MKPYDEKTKASPDEAAKLIDEMQRIIKNKGLEVDLKGRGGAELPMYSASSGCTGCTLCPCMICP